MLEITYSSVSATGRQTALGGIVLPVTTSATPSGSQPTTPTPADLLVIQIRSDVWANVDVAATPDPTGSALTIVTVGPGTPIKIRGRAGQKVSAIGIAAPAGAGGADLTTIRTSLTEMQARIDSLNARLAPDNSGWTPL